MRDQRGMTLIEVVIVVAAAALMLTAAAAYSIPWLARENMRGAVYDVQTYMQLARIEAVSRNRDCRFLVNTSSRRVQVYDSNATATLADDDLLYDRQLPDSISFARPDTGSAVTLNSVSIGVFDTTFTSDGMVSTGTGLVHLLGGQRYGRIAVFGAGGIQVQRWDGAAWTAGS